jgi:hypothetical protein
MLYCRIAREGMSESLCVAVAARARVIQKHVWVEHAASTTLPQRVVGRSVFPDGELLHVEACKEQYHRGSPFARSRTSAT